MSTRRAQLMFIVLLLACQLMIRIDHPAELPGFIDEYRHIHRAQMVYEFRQNPVEFSHGKLLFYYYLGLFKPEGQGALVAARLAVVIFSLLSGAAVVAIARDLFGRRTMIPALAYYVLVPHAVFYERMALADSFAGALAALTVWLSIRLVRRPSRRAGLIAGLVAAASGLAKLITVPLVGMPFLAVLCLNHIPRTRNRSQVLWNRYGRALNAARCGYIIPWIPVAVGLVISLQTGGHPIILDMKLIGLFDFAPGETSTKLDELIEVFDTLLSFPMTALLGGLLLVLLRKHRAETLFVLSWLALLWIPGIILGYYTKGRYLLIGQPALAVLFGGGIVLVGDQLGTWIASITGKSALRDWVTVGLILVVLGLWGGLFALPFDMDVARDPAALDLPRLDTAMFFASPANAWGIREALDFVDRTGDQVPVVGVLRNSEGMADYCQLVDLYLREDFDWDCTNQIGFPAAITDWPPLARYLERWSFVYVITDDVTPGTPASGTGFEQLLVVPRPHDGLAVSVWIVTG